MIKFRAKVKMPEKRNFARQEYVPEGQWVYGEPHTIDCPTPHIHTVDVGKQPIDKETIGQFTGLHDKNGNEIYEGDILLWHTMYLSVEWRQEDCRYVLVGCHDNEYMLNAYKCNIEDDFEVIGNIHDNPDLLKGGAQ